MKAKIWFKNLLLLLVILLILTVLTNFQYFKKQISYYFKGKKIEIIREPDTNLPKENLGQSNVLTIPSLDITPPVVYVNETSEEVFQEKLRDGVVHYPGTAEVGQVGNAYIFGHSSDYVWSKGDFKTVFALLPKIEIGAEIYITNQVGRQFKYVVTQKFVINPEDVSVLNQDTNGKKVLTLQTSYPIGTALKRYIVKAELK